MTTLTKEQLDEWNILNADRIGTGAFCGMVFNHLDGVSDEKSIEDAIQKALQVRVVFKRMNK